MFRWLSPQRLAASTSRHPWKTIAAWIVVVATIAALGHFFGLSAGDGGGDFTNRPDSVVGQNLIDQHFGKDDRADEKLVFHSDTLTVNDPNFQAVVEQTLTNLAPWQPDFASVTNYYDLKAQGSPDAQSLVSADQHSLVMPITFKEAEDTYLDRGDNYLSLSQKASNSSVQVYSVGDLSGDATYDKIGNDDTDKDMQVGLPVAAIVLLVVFGALIAAVLPILLGLIAIAATLSAVALLAHIFVVQSSTTILITMIGLAVGIDYSLFFLERFREERRKGALKLDAIERSGGTAGKAVLFSGGTVIFALLGLLIFPINIFQGIAIGTALTVVFAMSAALTLLPAILRLLGDWVNFPRVGIMWKLRKQDKDGQIRFVERRGRGLWGHLANAVMRRPVVAICLSGGILIACALPALTMRIGEQSVATYPGSAFKTGYEILERDFSAGYEEPIQIVVLGDASDPGVQSHVAALVGVLNNDARFASPQVTTSPDNQLTQITVDSTSDPYSAATNRAVKDLRSTIIPSVFETQAHNVHVTGDSASTVDFNTTLENRLPWVFAFVLGLSFILLLIAFRSIVVPLKSILLNMLSVGAAYGLTVAVFQHGWGASALGLTKVPAITNWLPVLLFCILFGLSMDYHVFLLSRIREHYDRTGNNDEAVAFGLQSTGRIITGAALIMVAVFAAFATGRIAEIQQFGFGMAVAVLLDATLIRSVLVPASMKLLGRANWYLPRWLNWLPDLRVEGDIAPIRPRSESVPTGPLPDAAVRQIPMPAD